MKKLLFIFMILLLMISNCLYAQPEIVAKDILKAYKTRNVELLKKNASGILKAAISDSYFEDKSIQDEIKAADNWDGEIIETRYESGNAFGKKMYTSGVHFADVPGKENEIYLVMLSSLDGKKWVMFGSGLITENKDKFEKMSLTLSETEKKDQTKDIEKPVINYSIEMANGETMDKVSEENLVESLNKLNDDNFFLILSAGDNFIQAAYSENGFTVQYKENGKQFEAKDYLSTDNTIEVFKKYYNGDNWKENLKWVVFE